MEQSGGAGHSLEIAKKLNNTGKLIGIDRDNEALAKARDVLKSFNNIVYVNDNHDNLRTILENLEINNVDGILLDLGVSSYQIDEESRGFSYIKNSPLDMRMDKNQELTAEIVVNTYPEEKLADIIYKYGEEKFSRHIARKICEYRKQKKIETTEELVKIIENSVPRQKQGGHPAKRTFQAIRIEVNNEIEPLYNTVINAIDCLNLVDMYIYLNYLHMHLLLLCLLKNEMLLCIIFHLALNNQLHLLLYCIVVLFHY